MFIPYANGKRCPVKALKAWLDLTGICSGPIFRAVNKHDQVSKRVLTAQSVSLIVKAAVEAVGGDPAIVSGHSLRAGYVTTAAMVGLQPYQIREQTGHRSDPIRLWPSTSGQWRRGRFRVCFESSFPQQVTRKQAHAEYKENPSPIDISYDSHYRIPIVTRFFGKGLNITLQFFNIKS